LKTPWFVIGVSILLVIASILRFLNFSIPSLVIAFFSIVAFLTSLAELLELMNKEKKYQYISLALGLAFFIGAILIWLFFPDVNTNLATSIRE
jgi:uncharacterized membrane protein